MKVDLFDYDLPRKFIAQKPLPQRDNSKLLVLDRKTGNIEHDVFYNLISYLQKGDVLVINESKVIKCRLNGVKEKTGASIECFVLEKIDSNRCVVLLKPSKRLRPFDKVIIGKYYFTVESKLDYGKAIVEFNFPIDIIMNEYGNIPTPPYIKNTVIKEEEYQTVYARKDGSLAAPTAGFHFSKRLIKKLEDSGIVFAKLNLSVGLDTFRPINVDEIEQHKMHSEYYSIEEGEAAKIRIARNNGNKITAVGTTTVRVLETLMLRKNDIVEDSGKTDIFIYPGFQFRVIDRLITNFHLPKSTLLAMVCAFAG
ncbi:MAG: tRNA preQ1(34) S-adenosylmethionine ribosyltransferase-isomerase QueA, partial [Candidatus Humimicrobiaceae bacterium]|nr:tRNA preQ1(34) S-adenosylmethionine ribosyltransferase-isomerase QueA [Candidatus Humimicrobiaceae bacterium]